VHEKVTGSCSVLLLTDRGIYAARDRLGRTPVVIGRKDGAFAVTLETCAFPNLGYEIDRELGPGEIVRLTPEGVEQLSPPGDRMQICAFLWIYYGFPASSYEGINVEEARYRCGAALARADDVQIDIVAGVPDSGVGHAIGYASEAGIPYGRPFVKYTPTWPRSFMPREQRVRDLVARMKLIPIEEQIAAKRLLFCEDSIVRGTQLTDVIQRLFDTGAREVHMRPACPPLVCTCKFLNFSRSRSELDLAGRKAIADMGGDATNDLAEYADASTAKYAAMIESIRARLGLTSLKYQTLDDMVKAIGLPREKLCTYCWSGNTTTRFYTPRARGSSSGRPPGSAIRSSCWPVELLSHEYDLLGCAIHALRQIVEVDAAADRCSGRIATIPNDGMIAGCLGSVHEDAHAAAGEIVDTQLDQRRGQR
jgi:amidophosphoribosyltransferase